MSFDSTGLDPRLLRALSKRGFEEATPVQVCERGQTAAARALGPAPGFAWRFGQLGSAWGSVTTAHRRGGREERPRRTDLRAAGWLRHASALPFCWI